MKSFSSSELKTILHSKRANLYFLEHCRVLVNGGRVEFVTEEGKKSLYWNIPIANSTSILLGSGTSITQAAMRELAKAGVLVGFCGGGGTPLYSAMEYEVPVCWMSPQSEYRASEYLQAWVKFWFDKQKRLAAAKYLQQNRLLHIKTFWLNPKWFGDTFQVEPASLLRVIQKAEQAFSDAVSTTDLLLAEALLTKQLFTLASQAVAYGDFTRQKKGSGHDPANRFLDYGNYLAYGMGATATWVLGLPHGLPVLHGKTRRGGLVFDAADIIKDALILPLAFTVAMQGHSDQEFRQICVDTLLQAEALDIMIDTLKDIATRV